MDKKTLEKRIEAGSWGTFFLWVGFAFLVQVGWGVGLLGIAGIVLATQSIRVFTKLGAETFWVIVGLVFAGSGLLQLFDLQLEAEPLLFPVALMAVGAVLLLTALFKRKHHIEH